MFFFNILEAKHIFFSVLFLKHAQTQLPYVISLTPFALNVALSNVQHLRFNSAWKYVHFPMQTNTHTRIMNSLTGDVVVLNSLALRKNIINKRFELNQAIILDLYDHLRE